MWDLSKGLQYDVHTEIHRNNHYFINCFTLCNHFAVCLSKDNFVSIRILSPNWVLSHEKRFSYIQVTLVSKKRPNSIVLLIQ